MNNCFSCEQNALEPSALPLRERVYDDGLWRVAHAFNSALPGWMVVVARRHIESLADLTSEEARGLGPLLQTLSSALQQVVHAQKAYVIFFAEKQGFSHLHIHVVPRSYDLPEAHRGANIFGYLMRPESEWISHTEMDRIASLMQPLLAQLID